MLCPNCKTEVPDGSFFCAECGADIIHDGGGEAVQDACRTVLNGDPPLATGGAEDEDDGRHGETAPVTAEAGPWEDGDASAAPSAEDTVPVSVESEGRKAFSRAGPEGTAGDLWDDICADDDGTQGDGYSPAPAPVDGEPANGGSFAERPATVGDGDEEENEEDRRNEDGGLFGAEQEDDAAVAPGEPVPVMEDGGDSGETAAGDDGLIRIREGSRSGPRRRVPMPYDPMEELMAEEPTPPNPPGNAGEKDPKRPFSLPQLPVIAGVAAAALVIVIIAAALVMGGGTFADDAGSPAADVAAVSGTPAASADAAVPGEDVAATPVFAEEMPAFTGSIVLMVSPTFDGYEAVVTGGSRIDEVAMVAITVEDKAGVHTMDWYYPYRGESFILMRGVYGGIRAQTERVMAVATFAGGQKELIWDEEY